MLACGLGRAMRRVEECESPPRSGGASGAFAPRCVRAAMRPKSRSPMLAHEIRTPLNGILALSELIAAADLPERERGWATQRQGCRRASGAICDAGGRWRARRTRAGWCCAPSRSACARWPKSIGATLVARARDEGAHGRHHDRGRPARPRDRRPGAAARRAGKPVDNAVKFTERGGVTFMSRSAPPRASAIASTFSLTDSGDGTDASPRSRGCSGRSRRRTTACRAPLWRRRARPCVREAARQGDGRQARRSTSRVGTAAARSA